MYIVPSFLDIAIENLKQQWKSTAHYDIAKTILLCNPQVTRMDDLMEYSRIINELSNDEAQTLTIEQARKLGLPI